MGRDMPTSEESLDPVAKLMGEDKPMPDGAGRKSIMEHSTFAKAVGKGIEIEQRQRESDVADEKKEARKAELTDKIIADKFKDEHTHYGLPEAEERWVRETKADFRELLELAGGSGKAETLLRQRERELTTSDADEMKRLRYELGIPRTENDNGSSEQAV